MQEADCNQVQSVHSFSSPRSGDRGFRAKGWETASKSFADKILPVSLREVSLNHSREQSNEEGQMNPCILPEDEQAMSVILSQARIVEAKHRLTEGHSGRVIRYAVQLGESLDLAEDVLQELRIASLLHDIGKIAVPDAILLKPGPLNAEETEIIKQHPITGENICAPVKSLRHILPV